MFWQTAPKFPQSHRARHAAPAICTISALLALSACQTTKPAEPEIQVDSWATISGINWQLTRIESQDATLIPLSPALASIRFDDPDRLSGSTGCNPYFGTFTRSGSNLRLTAHGSTQVQCIDPLMDVEDGFVAAMARIDHWEMVDGELKLTGPDQETSLTFSPIQP